MTRLILHTKRADHTGPCPYCDRAKEWLAERGVPFGVVEWDAHSRPALYDAFGLEGSARTVPQAVLVEPDGTQQRIGGFDALQISGVESLWRDA